MDILLFNITKQELTQIILSFNIDDKKSIFDLFDKGTLLISSDKKCLIFSSINDTKMVNCLNIIDYEGNLEPQKQTIWLDNYKKSILDETFYLASINQDESPQYDSCLNKIQALANITNILVDPSISRYEVINGQLYDNEISQFVLISKNAQIDSSIQYAKYSRYAFSMTSCKCSLQYDNNHMYSFNYGVFNASILDGTDKISDGAFGSCVNLSALDLHQVDITVIGNAAFSDTQITSLQLPQSLSTICSYAFEHTAIQQLTIPNKVVSIENGAFGDCYSLTAVELDNSSNISINEDAFENDRSLQSFVFKNYVSSNLVIQPSIFNGCLNLHYIVFSAGMDISIFDNCLFDRQVIDYKIVIPDDNYHSIENQLQNIQKLDNFHKYFVKYSVFTVK